MNSRLDQGNSRARLVPRFVIFGVVVAIVVTGLGIRLFDLQVARGGYYQQLSAAQQTTTIPVKTSRGLIYDRKGRLVADNVPTFAVKIRPADLPADQREPVTQRLGQILDMPAQQIIETIDSSIGSDFDLVTIKPDVPTETARVVAQDHLDLPGVYVDVEARREYLYGPLLAHILGFEGAIPVLSTPRSRARGTRTTTGSERPASSRRSRASCAARTAVSRSSRTLRAG